MTQHRGLIGPSALLAVVVVAGCSAGGSGDAGDSSCALSLQWDGTTYYALKVDKPVEVTGRLEEDAVMPVCDDLNGDADADTERDEYEARSIRGVDTAVAFASPERYPDQIFYSGPTNSRTYPPAIERLLGQRLPKTSAEPVRPKSEESGTARR